MKEGVLKELDVILLKCDEPTANGRIYSKKVIQKAMNDPWVREALMQRCFFGYSNLNESNDLDIRNIAFLCTSLGINDNSEFGAHIELLNTPAGNELFNYKGEVHFVLSGMGNIDLNANEEQIITDYEIHAICAVKGE